MRVGRRQGFVLETVGPRRLLLVAVVPLLVLALAGCGGGNLAPIPRGLEDRVESARDSVSDNWEGFGRPWFAFVEARCRADGGLVIVFAEQGFGADGAFAYAMAGGGAVPDSWSGGIGIDDPANDDELIHFFAEAAEVPCAIAPL
jgi:hypothetical protein